MENTSVFALSAYQYIIMAVIVTKSFPHKKPLYHNGESAKKFRNEEVNGLDFVNLAVLSHRSSFQ